MIQYVKNIGYGLDKKQLSNLILVSEYIYIYLIQYILLIFLKNLIETYDNIKYDNNNNILQNSNFKYFIIFIGTLNNA